MADTEEFLDDLFTTMRQQMGEAITTKSEEEAMFEWDDIESEAKQAILQHFQQEQEKDDSKVLKQLVKLLDKPKYSHFKVVFGDSSEEARKIVLEFVDKRGKESEKLIPQSEVDRLIREAIEKELRRAIEYARNLPDVGIRYPGDREKCREFARASSVMMNYVSTRLEELSKQKEGSNV